MKKAGFTLAELIITLSIIGIAAILVAPALTNLVPDKNKVKVIRYHAQLENTISDILNDESIYHPYSTDGTNLTANGIDSCEGLNCIDPSTTFEQELFSRLDFSAGATNYVYTDGSVWTFSENETAGNYSLQIDTDKLKSNHSYPSVSEPSKAVSFLFGIDKHGAVSAKDPLTEAFLRNPLNMNDKKTDYAWAKANKNKKY